MVALALATADATCSSSVDLPMPGSPPRRVTDPGTRPPLEDPVELGQAGGPGPELVGGDLGDGHRRVDRPEATAARTGASRSSTRVFHAPHDGQRPTHWGAAPPHSLHRKTDLTLAMGRPYSAGVTALLEHAVGEPQRGGRLVGLVLRLRLLVARHRGLGQVAALQGRHHRGALREHRIELAGEVLDLGGLVGGAGSARIGRCRR